MYYYNSHFAIICFLLNWVQKALLPYFLSSVLGNNITFDVLIGYRAEKTEHAESYFISCMGNLTKAQLQILKIFQNGQNEKVEVYLFLM